MFQSNKFRISKESKNISDLVSEAAELYNSYRGKEAYIEILKSDDNEVWALFKGHFCYTCGVNDWIEDFKYTLEDVGIEADLDKILEPEDSESSWRIGVFKIKEVKPLDRRTR